MWTSGCSASSNEELIQNLKSASIITSISVEQAMLRTDRSFYVPERKKTKEISTTYQYGPYADVIIIYIITNLRS